ncbi:MAG TPA: amino acid adenylation domain-containing protein, partial [Pseudonocardiaceae bacterium]
RAAGRGTAGGEVRFTVGAELTGRLAALGRERQASAFVLVMTAFAVLLHRYTRQPDLVVGVPMANRNREEWEDVVGLFVNTVALRADLSGRPTFAQVLDRVRTAAFEAYAHQDVPFDEVARRVGGDRDPAVNPVFQVACNVVETPRRLVMRGLTAEVTEVATGTAKLDLELDVAVGAGTLECCLEYSADLFDEAAIRRMAGHYVAVLEAMVAGPETPVTGFDLLSAGERRALVRDANATGDGCPAATLHELVGRQAAATPGAVAVAQGGTELTYGELDERSARIAGGLRALGVGPESVVAVRLPRSVDLVAALLGVLRAGAAFTPVDLGHPPRRQELTIRRSGARVVLDEALLAELTGPAEPVGPAGGPAARAGPGDADPENAAYVMFTSGSTGEPKGVVVSHRAIHNTIAGLQRDYRLDRHDVVLQSTALSFDPSVWQIFWPLTVGARVVLPPEQGHRDSGLLVELIRRAGVTVLDVTPAVLDALLDEPGWPGSSGGLRHVRCGGEALPVALWHRFRRHGTAELSHVYGPVEAAGEVTRWRGGDPDGGFVPLGTPNPGVTVYLLDEDLMPVPAGVPGELCVGGAAPARGYLGQPGPTAERFVPDPFGGRPGARLYRTGDLARRHPDGALEFLGRLDRQVKVRGMRAEPGEVEARLREVPGVRRAAVTVRPGRDGRPALAAYVEPAEVSRAAITGHLAATLPGHLVPATVHLMAALPLTTAGKLDIGALPVADPEPAAATTEPVTPTERRVADIWAEVFGLARVGREDHFFRLGGHSLLATKVLARVRARLRVDAPLRTIFEAPVLADLARRLDGLGPADGGAIPAGGRPALVPLSFAQERLWFIDQFEPGGTVYNVDHAVWLTGDLDLGALRRALDGLVRRHEVLRTTYRMIDERPAQVVADPAPVDLRVVDVPADKALDLAAAEAATPFDLTRGPLLRATVYRTAPDEHLLVLGTHHIAADDWSRNVLARELSALYSGEPVPGLPVQYADYALWQRRRLDDEALAAQLEHWRERLDGAPALLDLPTDRPRPPAQTYRGATEATVLPAGVLAGLRRVATGHDATPFMALLASFTALLGRYTGTDDIVVGTTVANRDRQEVEDLVGFFVNTLVLRTDLSGDPTFEELLSRVRGTTLDAYAHQDVPFEKLVEVLRPHRSLSHPPLVQVLFDLQNLAREPLRLAGLRTRTVDLEQRAARFDLVVSMIEDTGGLHTEIQYNSDLFDGSTVRRLLTHWRRLIDQVLATPARPVGSLSLLSDGEHRQVVAGWNRTARATPPRSGLAELFEEQAARTPDALALVHGGQRLTYRHLDERANRLAHRLIDRGVRPDERVGLPAGRSVDALVGLLGILKAGGAYVPLDPSYPPRRLERMARDAGVVHTLDAATMAGLDGLPTEAPRGRTHPDRLAYVLFTSGSTGRPKAVGMSHGALLNLFDWQAGDLPLAPGAPVLRFAPLGFDVSCQELFSTWQAGGTVVELPDDGTRRDPQALLDLMEDERVERWFVPYSGLVNVAHWALREPRRRDLRLRTVITAGEQVQLTPDLVSWLHRIGTGCALVNHYGPTETHAVTAYRVPDPPDAREPLPPIGRPIANTRVYLLDRAGQPVPVGVPGELYVGGAGLARGYLGRPGWTAERFVPDPFGDRPGGRLYRTGDLARYRPDGTLEFRGRADAQLKVRGHRVEPGEIEAVLEEHPAVTGAAVGVHGEGPRRRLVGYVVGAADLGQLREYLREYLRDRLPDYLVPADLVVLDALPLSRNGKLDRAALPAPGRAGPPGTGREPSTPAERAVARVWRQVLEVDRVDADDDFFELGGHSLLATRVVSRLRAELRLDIPVKAIFGHPTVAGLAAVVERLSAAVPDEPVAGRLPRQARSLRR